MDGSAVQNNITEEVLGGCQPILLWMCICLWNTKHTLLTREVADIKPIFFVTFLSIILCKDLHDDIMNPLSEFCFCWQTWAQYYFPAWKVLVI